MSHHGDDLKASHVLRELFRCGTPDELGATGQYPRGKLNADDEGEIKVAIAADPRTGTVLINFGKPVAWIGFSAEQASEIATLLQEKAWALRGIQPV